MSKKSCKPQFITGAMVPGILMYAPCCKKKKKKNGNKIKKWISREIVFKENMNYIEKAKVINETEKQMLEYLYKQKFPGCTIRSIRFSFKTGIDYNHMHIHAKVVFDYVANEGSKPKDDDPNKPVG